MFDKALRRETPSFTLLATSQYAYTLSHTSKKPQWRWKLYESIPKYLVHVYDRVYMLLRCYSWVVLIRSCTSRLSDVFPICPILVQARTPPVFPSFTHAPWNDES